MRVEHAHTLSSAQHLHRVAATDREAVSAQERWKAGEPVGSPRFER
jgi:hypothetical protein